MSLEPFADRVRALRDSWMERREVKALAGTHDFDSQFQLLSTLYSWTARAAVDVSEVYGRDLELRLSPPPSPLGRDAAFSVVVADAFVLSFRLTERQRLGTAGWFVSVSIASTGTGGNAVMAGPERRYGQWTHGRIEDLLLTMLGAYERSLSGESANGFELRARARG